jgi:hypothetical protein
MTRQLDPTVDRLQQTFRAVADQLVDEPPSFVAVPVAPTPPPHRRRALLVAAACVVVVAIGAVALVVTRDTRSANPPAIEPPSVSTTVPATAPPSLQHLVPGASGTITKISVQDTASYPVQPREYQLGYAGMVDGHAAQLMVTVDDFSQTQSPNFTLENHGCDTNGDGSPRFPGSIVPVGSHQACLITNIQNALHLGWIDDDGVSVLLQSSGLSVEQLEAVAETVERVPGDALTVELASAPPAGLELVGTGVRPPLESVWISFDQDGCSYFATSARADPVPFAFDPYSPAATIRGKPGRITGVQNVTWIDGDTRFGVSIDAQDVRQVADTCDSAAVAASLVPMDETAWQQLLADHPDLVQHNGS